MLYHETLAHVLLLLRLKKCIFSPYSELRKLLALVRAVFLLHYTLGNTSRDLAKKIGEKTRKFRVTPVAGYAAYLEQVTVTTTKRVSPPDFFPWLASYDVWVSPKHALLMWHEKYIKY